MWEGKEEMRQKEEEEDEEERQKQKGRRVRGETHTRAPRLVPPSACTCRDACDWFLLRVSQHPNYTINPSPLYPWVRHVAPCGGHSSCLIQAGGSASGHTLQLSRRFQRAWEVFLLDASPRPAGPHWGWDDLQGTSPWLRAPNL